MREEYKMNGYVIQEETSILTKPLFESEEKTLYPKTVIVNGSKMIGEFGRHVLFDRSNIYNLCEEGEDTYYWGILTNKGILPTEHIHYSKDNKVEMFGLEVPEVVVAHYKLREGDKVEIVVDDEKKLVAISGVNGCHRIKIITSWPSDLSKFQSDYPKEPLKVEKYGDFDLRVMTLLAPIGLGSSYWIIAPGGSGKTWILVKLFDACLKLTREISNLHVIMGYVGDRPEDAAQYLEVLNNNEKICGDHGELHCASWNTDPDCQVDVAKFVMNRARRLTAIGKNVVVLFDSISRTVAVHSASSYANSDSGMISGGIHRNSLTEMIALCFGTHGWYGDGRSLTLIGTVLSSSGDKKTSESAVDQETSDSSTTAICRLVKILTIKRPWISVNDADTYTRFPNGRDFRSEAQQDEMAIVKRLMRGGSGSSNSYEAHSVLLKYAGEHPLPAY